MHVIRRITDERQLYSPPLAYLFHKTYLLDQSVKNKALFKVYGTLPNHDLQLLSSLTVLRWVRSKTIKLWSKTFIDMLVPSACL